MSGKIYLLQNDKTLLEMIEKPYDNEDILQSLLHDYPDLLAGDQMDSANPRRWLLIDREMGVPLAEDGPNRMSLDHLFLDQDGIPTLVEVKRSSDTRIRREVVGQLLDYAANAVVYWPLQTLLTTFESACNAQGEDPAQLVRQLVNPDAPEDVDVDVFWQQVKTNLKAGKVRLVFVADEIPPELQRIVEFLNEQMDPAEVLAVAVKQYVRDNLRTLVPQVVGQTAEAQQRKATGRQRNKWDAETYFAEFEQNNGAEETAVARKILEWAQPRVDRIYWGEGIRDGSFVPILWHHKVKHQLFAVFTYGKVEIYFQYYMRKEPFTAVAKREELRQKLNAIPGVAIPEDAIERRPTIETAVLTQGNNLRQFINILDWVVAEIRAV